MKKSTDKRLNALEIDMNYWFKAFYVMTVIALLFGVLFNYEMYYIGLAIVFVASGRFIQKFSMKLHNIRVDDQELNYEREPRLAGELGSMDKDCDHDIEKLYSKSGRYVADYCTKCKGLY